MNHYAGPSPFLKPLSRLWATCAFAALVLAGCVTKAPLPHFYTLDMTPSGRAVRAAECGVDTVSVRAADALNRPELLVKKSPIEIEYYAIERWAGALDELVQQKLDAEFAGTRDPFIDDQALVSVEVEVLAFEQEDTASGARASAQLRVKMRHGAQSAGPIMYAAQRDVAPNPSAVAAGLSRALEDIAEAIAQDANRLAANSTVPSR